MKANKLINWSEVSRSLTKNSQRKQIGSTYNGKKYKYKVDKLKAAVNKWADEEL